MTTYYGRFRHFFRQQNPLNVFVSDATLQNAKLAYIQALKKDVLGNPDEFWQSKYLYDSAYHPTSGEKIILPGRMSFQAPGNSLLALGMLTFCRTTLQGLVLICSLSFIHRQA